MRDYGKPPRSFELSQDMYDWFLEDVDPFCVIYSVDQNTGEGMTKFMDVPVHIIDEPYSTTVTFTTGTAYATTGTTYRTIYDCGP